MGGGAFYGDAAVKARACEDAGAAAHPGWNAGATDAEKQACVEAYGLTAAFLNLLVPAARAPYVEGSCAFLEGALRRVAPGADLDLVTRSWMQAVWRDPEVGVEPKLRGSPAGEPAAAIVALVERSGRSAVPREEWRRARSALIAAMKEATPEAEAYARVAAAMAWSLEAIPGVAGDVWLAWGRAVEAEHALAAGWDQPTQDMLLETLRRCMRSAFERCGALPADADEKQQAAHAAAVQTETDRLMVESGQAEGWRSLQAFWEGEYRTTVMDWRKRALKTIEDACEEPATAAARS